MLGPEGDFITSPEISQIFGELLGVWVISEWMGAGGPKQLQLVELGPGKGSLASDILRVFSQLRSVLGQVSVSLHLVEVSPALSRLQAQKLTGTQNQDAVTEDEPVYRRGETAAGLQVSWYRRLEDVPQASASSWLTSSSMLCPSTSSRWRQTDRKQKVSVSADVVISSRVKFLNCTCMDHIDKDTIQLQQRQQRQTDRTERGWREVMVDIDPEKPEQLRFVIAPSPTLASSTLIQAGERRDHVEVCPEGGVIVQQLARRIVEDGGAVLIADYGHDGTKTDTFRVRADSMDLPLKMMLVGFKGHQLHDVLASPGSADLTADVDFSYLRRMAGGGVACLGPVTQRTFLKNMGIDTRMQVLLRNCSDPSTRKQLISSYDTLTNPAKMGERFHFFSLLHLSRLATPRRQRG
ncbi:hypothetical protein INR49_017983 [Caranx melampygus]|nr:hypothetical protein INR49_017983 [Caranx melampygus]